MAWFELLGRAAGQFRLRLDLVEPDQWTRPTPCDEWDVRGLVNHVVTAEAAAFREPGALERIVHHPAFDMPATQLFDLCGRRPG